MRFPFTLFAPVVRLFGGRRKFDPALPSTIALSFVFAIAATSSAQTYNVLYDFGPSSVNASGSGPEGQMASDPFGNLYGTTSYGGAKGCGNVYELSPPSVAGGVWTETVLHDFTCSSDGAYPLGGLTIDALGNLYGTTSQYGFRGGTVFKLKPPVTVGGSWSFSNIHVFSNPPGDGAAPRGPITLDASGNVYGTTSVGGTYNGEVSGGIAFKLTPGVGGYKETVLWNFGGPGDATYILSGLVADSSGNYYGTSLFGGAGNYGSVFELSPPSGGGTVWTESVVYSFPGPNSGAGEYPQGSLVSSSHGNLFGVATGSSFTCCGSVFELSPPTSGGAWTFKVLYTFRKGTIGYMPVGLSRDATATNLYGVTEYTSVKTGYGATGYGVVFKLAAPTVTGGSWTYSVLYEFNSTDGNDPQTPPLVDASGNVFGTAYSGGTGTRGVAYEITP